MISKIVGKVTKEIGECGVLDAKWRKSLNKLRSNLPGQRGLTEQERGEEVIIKVIANLNRSHFHIRTRALLERVTRKEEVKIGS